MKQALSLVLFITLAGAAPAQEGAAKPAAGDPPKEQTAAPAAEAVAKPEPAAAKSPDSFTPSEEISEDLPVSFPVDI